MEIKEQAIETSWMLSSLERQSYRVIFIYEMWYQVHSPEACVLGQGQADRDSPEGVFDKNNRWYAGISDHRGVEIIIMLEESVNTDKFLESLKRLNFDHPFDQISLFKDRLSVLTCRRAKEKMDILEIVPIYNAAYY